MLSPSQNAIIISAVAGIPLARPRQTGTVQPDPSPVLRLSTKTQRGRDSLRRARIRYDRYRNGIALLARRFRRTPPPLLMFVEYALVTQAYGSVDENNVR